MSTLLKSKFIKNYWYNIVEFDGGFGVFNTRRKKNQIDRDGLGYEIERFKTLKEAEEFLDNYEG